MKQFLVVSAAAAMVTTSVFAVPIDSANMSPGYSDSPGWVQQYSGTMNRLRGVFFLDSNLGWIVGVNGTILRTTDGGNTWTPQESGTSYDLRGVTFVDLATGWAVGDVGTILHTTDGGVNWTPQDSVGINSLTALSFVDSATGWVVGGKAIFHTTDGGATWALQNPAVPSGLLSMVFHSVAFTNQNDGLAVGTGIYNYVLRNNVGVLARTTDGGVNWRSELHFVSRHSGYNAITRVGNTAIIVGTFFSGAEYNGALIRGSTDGGDTWSESRILFVDAYGVSLGDAETGWWVGRRGWIFRTTDQGANWTQQVSPTVNVLWAISSVDANTAWAVGENGIILHTTTGGE